MFKLVSLMALAQMRIQTSTWRKYLPHIQTYVFGALMVVAFVSVTHNLEYYPKAWFDEGWYLQVPKNIVLYGEYATRSSEGFRLYDIVMDVSPVFYLPIAVAFKLWGIGLWQARIVSAMFFLLAGLCLYALAREVFDTPTALLALALFIFVKADDYLTSALLLGRLVMGEVPATAFFLAGSYAWFKAFKRHSRLWLALAGCGFGLAIGIKSQFLIMIPTLLIALGLFDHLYYRQRRSSYFVIPLLTAAGMVSLKYLAIAWLLGPANFLQFLSEFFALSGPQVRVFLSPLAMQAALKLFLRSSYFIWVVPALAYTIGLSLKKQPANIQLCFLWLCVTIWLGWFMFASIGWSRYTFHALCVSYILVAKWLVDLSGSSVLTASHVGQEVKSGTLLPVARAGSVMLLVGMLLLNSAKTVLTEIWAEPDRSLQQFAAYLDTHIGPDAIIET